MRTGEGKRRGKTQVKERSLIQRSAPLKGGLWQAGRVPAQREVGEALHSGLPHPQPALPCTCLGPTARTMTPASLGPPPPPGSAPLGVSDMGSSLASLLAASCHLSSEAWLLGLSPQAGKRQVASGGAGSAGPWAPQCSALWSACSFSRGSPVHTGLWLQRDT